MSKSSHNFQHRPGLNDVMKNWVQTEKATNDENRRLLAAAVALWVDKFNPEQHIGQCLTACQFIKSVLAMRGVHADIIPAWLVLVDPSGEKQIGEVGALSPRWSGDGSWNGHCVLFIPESEILFDPTVGQSPDLRKFNPLAWTPLRSHLSAEHKNIMQPQNMDQQTPGMEVDRGLYLARYLFRPQETFPEDSPLIRQLRHEIQQNHDELAEELRLNT